MKVADIKPHYDTDVLNAIPMHEVVSRFQNLKRRGANYVALCPWHEDKTPSLTIYENNRENHCHCFACGSGGGPISYVMQQGGLDFLSACAWLAREFGQGVVWGNSPTVYIKRKPFTKTQETEEPKEYTYIPMEIVDGMVSCESSFVKCMMQVFEHSRVEFLVEEYKLGCYEYNEKYFDDVVFPSIDVQGRVHNLKIQNYCTDPKSEAFFHCAKKHCLWIGKDLIHPEKSAKEPVFDNYCLFGAHLLAKYPNDPVVLVESPKNAIIGAAQVTDAVWVATGSKIMLKERTLKCLKGRDVIVYPDCDAFNEWKTTLSTPKMRALANFVVSDFCKVYAPEGQEKFDIADYILSKT